MKIALIGYGKMGHMIEGIALERGHEIVGIIDPTLVNGDCSLVTDFDSEEFRSADVAIEFTTPATAKENILRAWAQNVPVVCGTTGWKPEELRVEGLELREVDSRKLVNGDWSFVIEGSRKVVKDEKGKTMLVWSSNFSVGVNIFFEMNKFLAQKMKNLTPRGSMDVHRTSNRAEPFTRQGEREKGEGYTPSIKEIHHIHKLDKPSGTAKTLAEQIENELPSLQGGAGGRLPIESIREGEVPGTHEVKWDSEEDTIIITHIAKGRRGFALGAVLAAESLV